MEGGSAAPGPRPRPGGHSPAAARRGRRACSARCSSPWWRQGEPRRAALLRPLPSSRAGVSPHPDGPAPPGPGAPLLSGSGGWEGAALGAARGSGVPLWGGGGVCAGRWGRRAARRGAGGWAGGSESRRGAGGGSPRGNFKGLAWLAGGARAHTRIPPAHTHTCPPDSTGEMELDPGVSSLSTARTT